MSALFARLSVFVAKLPGMFWVIAFIVALLAGAAFGLVKHGEHVQLRKDERRAREGVTQMSRLKVAVARATEDTLIRRADETKPAAVAAGVKRQQLRERVELVDSAHVTIDGVLAAADPVLVALVAADDAKIHADSVHLVPLEALPEATRQTRAASVAYDSLLVKQANDAEQSPTHHLRDAAIGATTVVVAVVALLVFHH